MPIQLLSPQLANQIAAGEVVERPASVVKELLENSLDAGATKIEVDIEKGGHKRIRIKDNGSGIVKSELQLALSRHATSKITTLDDLEQILSLGFRGEALASISSVSRLTLTSRTESQGEAWQAYCEGREMAVNIQPAAHPVGTTIDVADLFYNTPARRKFLRTEKTEFQHIEEVIKRIALSYPKVSFVLKHNDKVAKRFIADKAGSLATRIGAVVGQKFVQNAVHISTEYEGLHIDAWLGNEAMLRSSNDCQFSFVNGRGMRDKLIMHAIRQAYESVWGVVEQPSFVVYLTVNPKDVDVNVHPAKHEVRFQQGRLVHDFICKTVSDALHAMTDEQPLSGMDASRPSGSDFMSSQVEHDYIRPLQNQTSDNAQAFNESSRYSTGGISQGAPQSYGQFTGSPRNTSSGSASGGRSGGETDFEDKLRKKTLTSGCAQGTVFGDLMENFEDVLLAKDVKIKTSELYRLLHTINSAPSLYLEAGAIHGCVLCEGDHPLIYMEDVGRHNAVDKIAGYMFQKGISGEDKIFYTTGRLTSEMVIKTVQMGIPILVSRSGFTAWGVDLAKEADLTLIGRAKGKRFLVFAAPHRIEYDAPAAG